MTSSLVWISGASGGIGGALTQTVPWENARVIGISRQRPAGTIEHLEADLADPSTWSTVGASFRRELHDFTGQHVAFIHAAGVNESSALPTRSIATPTRATCCSTAPRRRFSVSFSWLRSKR